MDSKPKVRSIISIKYKKLEVVNKIDANGNVYADNIYAPDEIRIGDIFYADGEEYMLEKIETFPKYKSFKLYYSGGYTVERHEGLLEEVTKI